MYVPTVSHAETAAPLAARMPARRGRPWKVRPAPYGIRPNAATSRLTSGRRSLVLVEQAGVVEVYMDRPDDFAVTPAVTVDGHGPDVVGELARAVMQTVLPRLEREAANTTLHAYGREQVVIDTTGEMNEVGFALIDHGAHPRVVARTGGVGNTWTDRSGGEWGVWVIHPTGNLTLSYEGPVSGLYGVLPLLLPPAPGHESTDAGSVFTRHLSDRFPQLRPVDGHEVEFGGYGGTRGFIALPASDEPTGYADDSRRVAAQVERLGVDLLLSAVSHLV